MANKIEINLFLDHLKKVFFSKYGSFKPILLTKKYLKKQARKAIFLPF